MARQDQYNVTVSIDGLGNLGTFDKFAGGEIDSDEQTYNPGAMAPPVSLGGSITMGDVTVSRLYVLERDHVIMHKLLSLVGVANITAAKQPLDINKVPFGRPLVYTGVVKTVTPPDHDSTSSDPALFDIVFTPSGTVG